MNVAVDAAWKCQQTGCVDLACRPLYTICDTDDTTLTNADIGLEFVACSRDRATADGEVELCHVITSEQISYLEYPALT